MSAYETCTTVGGHGEIRLSGLPFEPGTEVAVVVSPKNGEPSAMDAQRVSQLMAALNHTHNNQPVGPLRRDELYDRDTLR